MRKYYDEITRIAGNVVSVTATGVGYDELAIITSKRGRSLAQVIHLLRIPHDLMLCETDPIQSQAPRFLNRIQGVHVAARGAGSGMYMKINTHCFHPL